MTTPRFDVLAVGSPLHGAGALRRALEPSLRALASLGGRAPAEAGAGAADPLVVLVGTGGPEAEILRLHGARQAVAPGDPLLLVTHPAHNSLPAALEALARLRQDGARGRIVHLPGPDDGPALARLSAAIDDLCAFRRLHRSRIGLVGGPARCGSKAARSRGYPKERVCSCGDSHRLRVSVVRAGANLFGGREHRPDAAVGGRE